ncbi:MAG TPA: hypothetical protein VF283_01610 [Bryobacteraceae bacterium]
MSAAAQTKIFGIRVGVNPKLIVVVLLVLAGLLFWYNSSGGEGGGGNTAVRAPAPASAPATQPEQKVAPRHVSRQDRSVLRFRKIDPANSNVDPTLRLDLLARLQRIQLGAAGRNIFETGPAPAAVAAAAKALKGPVVRPNPIMAAPRPAATAVAHPAVNIPLKYYGFVKPARRAQPNRGFFLDGDKVLVASEGQIVLKRYLVVELTPNIAKMEDVQLRQGRTLPVVPAAVVPQ